MARRFFRPWVWWGGLVLIVCAGSAAVWRLWPAAPDRPSTPGDLPRTHSAQSLPDEDRAYIWDIEHQGLVLKKYGFGSLKAALRDENAAALLNLLAADFQGEVLANPREIGLASDAVEATRQEEVAGRPRQPLGREPFVGRLLEYRRRFVAPPDIDMALMTLSPESPADADGPWKGEVQLRMWGGMGNKGEGPAEIVRAASLVGRAPDFLAGLPTPPRPGEIILTLQFRIARPTEENLSTAGWLRGCSVRQSLASDAPQFLFKDVTAERGIDAGLFYDNWTRGKKPLITIPGGVYLTDFDRDGCLDMLITDVNRVAFYKGLPDGRFLDVTARVGLPLKSPEPAGDVAAFVDLDGDGWEDLILGHKIFRNVSDGKGGRRFEDATAFCNLRIPDDATGIAVADYDRDGHMDLYITCAGQMKASSWVDGTGAGTGNQLWHNTGKGLRFENVTAKSGAGGDHRSTFSAVWLDADNDGWPDLYAINEFGDGVLLLNNRDGTFRERRLTDGLGDFGSMGVTCGDVDNDGNIDLYVASMYSKAGARVVNNVRPGAYAPELMAQMKRFVVGSQLYLNRGQTKFESKGKDSQVAAVGWAYGAALIDLDNDGWLDLFATAGFVSQDRGTPDG